MPKSPKQMKMVDRAVLSRMPLIGVFWRLLKVANVRGRKPCSLAATTRRLRDEEAVSSAPGR